MGAEVTSLSTEPQESLVFSFSSSPEESVSPACFFGRRKQASLYDDLTISAGQLQALSRFLCIGMKGFLMALREDFWKIVEPLAVFVNSENEVSRLEEARDEVESTDGDVGC